MRQDDVDNDDDDLEQADKAQAEKEAQESSGVPDERDDRDLLVILNPDEANKNILCCICPC